MTHDLLSTDQTIQYPLVQNNPKHRWKVPSENCLPLHPCRYVSFNLMLAYASFAPKDGPRIVLGLQ